MADSIENQVQPASPENTSDLTTQNTATASGHTETVNVPEGHAVRVLSPEELEYINMMHLFFSSTQSLIGATPNLSHHLFDFVNDKKEDGTMQGGKIKDIVAKSLDGIPFVNQQLMGFSIRPHVDSYVYGYLEPIISGKMTAIEFLLSKQGQTEPEIQREIFIWKKNIPNIFTQKVIDFFGAKLPKSNTNAIEPNNPTA
jgi:hypothetical protein